MNRLSVNWYGRYFATVLAVVSLGINQVSAQTADQDPSPVPSDSTVDSGNQGFALFEAIENSASRTNAPVRRNSRQARATVAEPEFTLLGTSRIGNKYSAIIQHKDGETIVVKADPTANTAIPEHDDYSIVSIVAGAVSIRYPGSTECIEFTDRGVSCNAAGNTAELALATGESLAPSPRQVALVVEEQALEEAEAAITEASNNRFSPRRIEPEDVPPGMRVVSTPFGDRLVEQ